MDRRADLERELELAKRDIDTPRPQFWRVDLIRYREAKKALEKFTGEPK